MFCASSGQLRPGSLATLLGCFESPIREILAPPPLSPRNTPGSRSIPSQSNEPMPSTLSFPIFAPPPFPPVASAEQQHTVPLENGGCLHVTSTPSRASLRIRSHDPAQDLTIELRFEAQGPALTIQANNVEICGTESIDARCKQFRVEAEEHIQFTSHGSIRHYAQRGTEIQAGDVRVHASPGGVQLRANDDVQLLGEGILLNCDRPATPPPTRSPAVHPAPPRVPASRASGDAEIVEHLSNRR